MEIDENYLSWEKADLIQNDYIDKCKRSEFGYTKVYELAYFNRTVFLHGINDNGYTNSIGFFNIYQNKTVEIYCRDRYRSSVQEIRVH